jgi:hypothetical protein
VTAPRRCTTHPREAAGWRCQACGALLCPACTVLLRVGSVDSDGCSLCRGLAERLRERRQEARPFAGRIVGAFSFPLRHGALLSILALAVVMRLLQIFGLLGSALASGVYWAFLFGVIVQTWRGKEELEPPDFTNVIDDVLFPALRGLLATALVWVPLAFRAAALLSELGPERREPAALASAIAGDPLVWLLLLLGAAFLPAALIAAAITRSFLAVVNPLVPIQMARALGADYLRATATTAGLGVAGLLLDRLVGATAGRIPILGGFLATAIGVYFPIVNARILGLLVHVRGDDLGLGQESDYLEPVLPGATPQGGTLALEPAPRRPRTEGAAFPGGPAPIARAVPVRGEEEPPGAQGDEPVLPTVAVEPPAAPVPPAEDPWVVPPLGPLGEIQAAVGAGDLGRAYGVYRKHGGRVSGLGAGDLFQLARGAAQAGDHPVAAWALSSAAAFPDDPVAPDVLLVLGRIYRGRLGKPEEARQTFLALVARYPESAAARQARDELRAGG